MRCEVLLRRLPDQDDSRAIVCVFISLHPCNPRLKLVRLPPLLPLPVAALPSMSLVPLAPFIKNKKPCAENAWPILAPFGGITRIRFKGFPALCYKVLGLSAS